MREEELIYNFIIVNEIATEAECDLVTNINGYSVESLTDIIHSRTEYHSIRQLWDCEKDNYYFNEDIKSYYDLENEEEEGE